MGNCVKKQSRRDISPSDDALTSTPASVSLHGSDACPVAASLRLALLFKSVAVRFVPSDPSSPILLQCGPDAVSGDLDSLLRYIDRRFAGPPVVVPGPFSSGSPPLAAAVAIQHRSLERLVDRAVEMAGDLTVGKGTRVGSPRGLGKLYSMLLEVLLEHAQMEERIVFPALERADRGLSRIATEEHARDLPMMNGIKEDIKAVGVMDSWTPAYQEALVDLVGRLRTLQENTREHFMEEERDLLSLLEDEEGVIDKCIEVMESTHSHLFPFFISSLLPHEAIHYLSLLLRFCSNQARLVSTFRSLTAHMDALPPPTPS
ncbi:hypothetical protein QJS04_geneDACA011743 [Acorus gramineus]|uniref:Hemerythrin-like domain-containing protein n=1 Tax=Acorus gramineus TaxID=55184 RepID=A0AAV9BH10_ACOGR|nr:hypothetical protein QJS04_geneDACA011743 [Acorus gramineus]